jgi:hypothetical protein
LFAEYDTLKPYFVLIITLLAVIHTFIPSYKIV